MPAITPVVVASPRPPPVAIAVIVVVILVPPILVVATPLVACPAIPVAIVAIPVPVAGFFGAFTLTLAGFFRALPIAISGVAESLFTFTSAFTGLFGAVTVTVPVAGFFHALTGFFGAFTVPFASFFGAVTNFFSTLFDVLASLSGSTFGTIRPLASAASPGVDVGFRLGLGLLLGGGHVPRRFRGDIFLSPCRSGSHAEGDQGQCHFGYALHTTISSRCGHEAVSLLGGLVSERFR